MNQFVKANTKEHARAMCIKAALAAASRLRVPTLAIVPGKIQMIAAPVEGEKKFGAFQTAISRWQRLLEQIESIPGMPLL